MSDREKLIELLKQNCHCKGEDCKQCSSNGLCFTHREADTILADNWVRLPCKVGETLYDIGEFVDGYDCPEIYELKDNTMSFEKYEGGYRFTYDCFYIYPDDLGKRLFTSREDAEEAVQALKGVKE